MIVVATGLAASALGATAIREANASRRADSTVPSDSSTAPAAQPVTSTQATTPTIAAADSSASKAQTSTPDVTSAAAPTNALKPAARLTPIIPIGASSLPNGVGAVRSDSAVVVSFDIPMIRTRFPDKFEHFVRATLPAVYGPLVDSILAKVPTGSFARQGSLLTELPSRGVRIPIDSTWELRVYPETRPGQDGPLVIRYRATTASR